MIKITEARDRRDETFDRILGGNPKGGHPHQHELWPCVRQGAGERWLTKRGMAPKPSRRMALYYLRGKSAEDLVRDQNMPPVMVIYKGVAFRPDQWVGDSEMPFEEIKSTNLSSFPFYKLAQRGSFSLQDKDLPGQSYFEQMAFYCLATGARRAFLTVYFLHGDYADRRKNCPNCKAKLGELQEDRFKLCPNCGYKSKTSDLWTYELEFSDAELRYFDGELDIRAPQWYSAQEAESVSELLERAQPTPGFKCGGCDVGKVIGCEYAGKKFE